MAAKRFCQSEQDLAKGMREWLEQQPGIAYLEQEKACLNDLLPKLFGYYLIQLGMAGSLDEVMGECKIGSCLVLATEKSSDPVRMDAQISIPQLPIATESVDAVLLPHTLDFSPNPHQVLREAERILIPDGRIIITGFNPWSSWGLYKLLFQRKGKIPWCGQFISQYRLQDWLRLLNFNVEITKPVMYRPPLKSEAMLDRLQFMEKANPKYFSLVSAGYVVQAVKRVTTYTPVRPGWKKRARAVRGKLLEPTTRG
jgi:SAM-dependent methyltransferase